MALSGAAVLAAVLGVAAPAFPATASPAAKGGNTGLSLLVTPKSLDFGAQEVGTTSAAQTLTVTTTGSAQTEIGLLDPLGVNFVEYTEQPGPSVPGAGCTDVFLAPGANCTVSFTFAPHAVGPQPTDVEVLAFPQTAGPLVVAATATVTGRGTSPGAFVGSITLPSQVAQNGVVVGQSVTATVSLSNTVGGRCAIFHEPITVDLGTSFPSDASVPSQVVVPAGQCSATFTITTAPTTVREMIGISGTVASDPNAFADSVGVGLTINP